MKDLIRYYFIKHKLENYSDTAQKINAHSAVDTKTTQQLPNAQYVLQKTKADEKNCAMAGISKICKPNVHYLPLSPCTVFFTYLIVL